MKNKYLLLVSLLLIVSTILASCGGSAPAATEPPQPEQPKATPATSGGSGSGSDTGSSGTASPLDPANASGEKTVAALGYAYEGLVSMKDGKPVAALARSFGVSDDGLEYTFYLRPGVTFHDGSELNADLVILNFNRWFDPNDANRGAGKFEAWVSAFKGFKNEVADGKPISQYDGIEKVNDYTVLVHLNTPDPDFITKIANSAFVISSVAGFTGGDGGSGPYMIASSDASALKLEPFAGYWDTAAIPTAGMDAPLK